jgi:cobalt-zinc-cadmium efflux system membrane fusion protein
MKMNRARFLSPLLLLPLAIALGAAGYMALAWWKSDEQRAAPASMTVGNEAASGPTDKIIVSDQAQRNLGLTAKSLQAGVFWKTVTIQGMVVDRPGFSDREIVAPAIGVVVELYHVPGDMVQPGDKLFKLKLASESLQQTQSELFKTSENIQLAEARRDRLVSGGQAIAQARVIEAENEIARLEVSAQAYRQELLNRGFSPSEVDGVAKGGLLNEITLAVPPRGIAQSPLNSHTSSISGPADERPLAYEFQELKVELGEQVQAGQTLCHLSNHQFLAIEGRAFRDETFLLERSVQEGWPVEVDFQEDASGTWPPIDQIFLINYIANTIDPVTRTFAFLMPLENQYKTVEHGDRKQLLWRFRPGQKVLLRIRIERLDDVFVLPADAVVLEGADAFVFTQNVNTFQRKGVHVVFRDRDRVVLANDGALTVYEKRGEKWTIPAVALRGAAQLNRMTKAGTSGVPKGYHIHADGSLHKNEDEGK